MASKPFTCSNLMGPREGDLLSPEQTYTLRYTALTASVAEELQRLFTPGDLLTFEGLDLSVEATAHDPAEHPWACSDDYQALAVALGKRPRERDGVRARLKANIGRAPLFNPSLFVRNLEQAYLRMWRRYQSGESPATITMDPN